MIGATKIRRRDEWRRSLRWVATLQLYFLLGVSCPPSISLFDETAYQKATSLKVESLRLMDQATEPYREHQTEVRYLRIELEKAYEYAKGRPKNQISTRQWTILMDPERNLLAGFLKRWEVESALNPVFVREAQGLVSDAFDTIINLESGKIKKEQATIVGG